MDKICKYHLISAYFVIQIVKSRKNYNINCNACALLTFCKNIIYFQIDRRPSDTNLNRNCNKMKLLKYPETSSSKDEPSSSPSVAVTFNIGRLGNQLSSLASLYSVWREFNVYNFITEKQWSMINEVFDVPMNPQTFHNDDWPYFIWDKGTA